MKKLLNIFAISLLVAAPAFGGWNPSSWNLFGKVADVAKEYEGRNLPEVPAVPQAGDMDMNVFVRVSEWLPEYTRGRVLLGAGIVAGTASAVYCGNKLYKWYAKRAFVRATETRVNAYLERVDAIYTADSDILVDATFDKKQAMMPQLEPHMVTFQWANAHAPACLREYNGDIASGLIHLIAGNTQDSLLIFQQDYFLKNNRSEARQMIFKKLEAIKQYIENFGK